jgi:hypothetical protein
LTILPKLGKFTNRSYGLKKENIILLLLTNKVTIAGRVITEIYCDLKHIHYGWDAVNRDYNKGPARNSYKEEDVIAFFEQLNTLAQDPIAQTTRLKSVEQRFVFYVYDGNKKLKMVVDLMKNQSTIVVTIH